MWLFWGYVGKYCLYNVPAQEKVSQDVKTGDPQGVKTGDPQGVKSWDPQGVKWGVGDLQGVKSGDLQGVKSGVYIESCRRIHKVSSQEIHKDQQMSVLFFTSHF